MIGQSKMSERLHDMTQYRMFLDLSVLPKKKKEQIWYNKHLILIIGRLYHCIQDF